MEEFYLLDYTLLRKYIIDVYSSAIWTPRYNTVGDCELVIQASQENFKKIKECKYIARDDDDMVCEIKKIEITTDVENGDQFIITGIDIKKILQQRIVEKQTNFNGKVEDYIRTLIEDSIINPTNSKRKINNFILADKVGFTETVSEQITYDNVGQKIEEICKQHGWGYKVTVTNGNFIFSLYQGKDKSSYIKFSQNYDNITTTDYIKDDSNIKNIAVVAGEGEGVERITTIIGEEVGINRHEIYVDARNISSSIDYDELVSSYPNGTEITKNGVIYYQVDGVDIAIITKDDEGEVSEVRLCDDIYIESLKSKGKEEIASYTSVTSFEGKIVPGINYTYKKDYNLGDIVSISNEYGISMKARITEIVESQDKNGYIMEPTFEDINK